MNEDEDARLSKAAMKSLRVPAPESLKANLKRLARSHKPKPTLWDRLRERFAVGESGWAYGAGAAFASVAVAVVLVRAVPERAPAERRTVVIEPSVQSLAELWADDAGEDNDEI